MTDYRADSTLPLEGRAAKNSNIKLIKMGPSRVRTGYEPHSKQKEGAGQRADSSPLLKCRAATSNNTNLINMEPSRVRTQL